MDNRAETIYSAKTYFGDGYKILNNEIIWIAYFPVIKYNEEKINPVKLQVIFEDDFVQFKVTECIKNKKIEGKYIDISKIGSPYYVVDEKIKNYKFIKKKYIILDDNDDEDKEKKKKTLKSKSAVSHTRLVEIIPDVSRGERAPDVYRGEIVPDVYMGERVPDVYMGERVPDVYMGERVPDVYRSERVPDVYMGERAPDVSRGERVPDVYRDERVPDVFRGERAPDVYRGEIIPDVYMGEGVPDVYMGERIPGEVTDERVGGSTTPLLKNKTCNTTSFILFFLIYIINIITYGLILFLEQIPKNI